MATVVPNPAHPSARTTGEVPAPSAAPPSYATREDREPGAARSAVPVVVSVGLLFGLAVAAAFVGRGIIEMLTGMLGQ